MTYKIPTALHLTHTYSHTTQEPLLGWSLARGAGEGVGPRCFLPGVGRYIHTCIHGWGGGEGGVGWNGMDW
jgi:hypothetical protein